MMTKVDWMNFYLNLNSQENDLLTIGEVINMVLSEVKRGNK